MQITASISAAFKSDQRLLDISAVFQKTDNPIRYNQLFNWVWHFAGMHVHFNLQQFKLHLQSLITLFPISSEH